LRSLNTFLFTILKNVSETENEEWDSDFAQFKWVSLYTALSRVD